MGIELSSNRGQCLRCGDNLVARFVDCLWCDVCMMLRAARQFGGYRNIKWPWRRNVVNTGGLRLTNKLHLHPTPPPKSSLCDAPKTCNCTPLKLKNHDALNIGGLILFTYRFTDSAGASWWRMLHPNKCLRCTRENR